MKALLLKGLKESLIYEDIDDPKSDDKWEIVTLKAAAFNRRDYWVTQGKYPGIRFPVIPGSDGTGICDGREVVIQPGINWGNRDAYQGRDYQILGMPLNGTFAEKVAVPEENIFPKPPYLNWEEAAAIPLAGLTAYRAVISKAKVQPGEKVLITGIGGGVASMCLLFCRAIGGSVFVTSGSNEKIEKSLESGAIAGFNYKNENWIKDAKQLAGGFDVIIDSAAGEGFNDLLSTANPGCRIVMYGGTRGSFKNVGPWQIFWKQLQILGTTMGSPDEFGKMLKFMIEHRIHPFISTVLPLEKGQKGMEMLEHHEQFGKIVLRIF